MQDYCDVRSGSGQATQIGNTTDIYKLDAEQEKYAFMIYDIGSKREKITPRDILIAYMATLQEAGMRNLDYGDRDSKGLFQMRPYQPWREWGWGTVEQIMDPNYSINKFFTELEGVENRESLSLTQAAQAVERSAFPNAYAKWEPLARDIYATVSKERGLGSGTVLNIDYTPTSYGDATCSRYGSTKAVVSEGWALPLASVSVGSKCGMRVHPITGEYKLHDGEDLSASTGTPIYAITNGIVVERGYNTAWGNTVLIRSAGGLTYRVAHLSSYDPAITVNAEVAMGQKIGEAGSTGYSTGSHLHLSTYINDIAVRPMELIYSGGDSIIKCGTQNYSYG
jgi:murein DD-endopeptidase MepM/ murein hydrolase activator NlpD